MPYKTYQMDGQWCVHKLNDDGSRGERVESGCYDDEGEAQNRAAAMNASVNELAHNFTDVAVIWELRGDYPQDIPTFPGVDVTELTAGDDDPMFLTLPIGKANAKSDNGRYYDEEWLQELERQVVENRPVGIMGHIRAEDVATEFPPEAIHWVGVRRIGEMLWGKGYVPPGEARERVRRYKATNKKLATSIFAKARGVWDGTVGALRMVAETLQLHQIDIGPADRVGIPSLAAVPRITAEMMQPENETEQETDMDKMQVIREMTVEDARLLPDPVREAILADVDEPAEVAIVAELRSELGLDEKADLPAVIGKLKEQQEQQAKRAVEQRIQELVTDEEKGVKVEAARPIVTELVQARAPSTPEEAEAAFTEVVASEQVKGLLSEFVQQKSGPRQRVVAGGKNGQPKGKKGRYFDIPDIDEESD